MILQLLVREWIPAFAGEKLRGNHRWCILSFPRKRETPKKFRGSSEKCLAGTVCLTLVDEVFGRIRFLGPHIGPQKESMMRLETPQKVGNEKGAHS